MITPNINPAVWDDLQALPADDLVALIETFLHSGLATLSAVRRAVRQGDVAPIPHLLHRLKGGSASMGGVALAQLCHEFEDQIRAGTITDMDPWLPRVEAAYARLALYLEEKRSVLAGRGIDQRSGMVA